MNPLPYLRYDSTKGRDLYILLHGQQSSKREWLEKDGYTHGGNLTDGLMDNGFSFIAFDLYGHGDSRTVDYSKDYLDDEEYQDFIGQSVQGIGETLSQIKAVEPERRIHLVTYSTGSVAGLKVQEQYGLFEDIYLAVPVPQKEYDDEFSLHNNISKLKENSRLVVFYGNNDEEVAASETEWFYDQIPCSKKQIFAYDSGHSLPSEWVRDFINLLLSQSK